ncbi:MAG: Rne/Rng family ribonuclease [Acetobacteraceae bacterium]
MTKRMLIDATHAEETRVVVLDGNRLEDFDVETSAKRHLKGNIYLAKVVRVEPSLQAAFVEYGGNRHGFLAFSEIHPDYYQIPVADRQRLLDMEAEEARREEEEDELEFALTQTQAAEPPPEDRGRPGAAALRISADTRSAAKVGDVAEPWAQPGTPALIRLAASTALAGSAAAWARPAEPTLTAEAAAGAQSEAGTPESSGEPGGESQVEPQTESGDATPGKTWGKAGAAPAISPTMPFPWAQPGQPPLLGARPAAGDAADQAAGSDGSLPMIDEDGDDDIDTIDPANEAPPPEEMGGDSDSIEDTRERRSMPRFMRNYKIQEVIRRRQIMLVQVVKEERGTKGAALTTYLSLAGRFSVLMPNSPRGGGISRKITAAADRRRLREVMTELDIPRGMGLIIRTAGAARPKPEIKRDCEYLLRLWDDIRDHTMKSVAPALIYEEASLIKRAIRDVYSRDIDEIQVDGRDGWRAAHEFMRMLMPSHAKKVLMWPEGGQPLFARYQVEAQLDAMMTPVVQLRSGGYLVINQAEALVAIDVNSGRSTRERNIEETALRTNLEAADEVARQLRLRDLAGLIVIDFIDMESKRHNAMVERRLKEALKNDRARIQVGHISHFGLMEMSRQRLRPSLAETNFVTCPHCGGTGHVRSTESAAIHVLRGIEEEGSKRRAAEIIVHMATPIALYLLNHKRDRLREIEMRYAMRIIVAADDAMISPRFRIERVRIQTPGEAASFITPDMPPPPMPAVEEALPEVDAAVEDEPEAEQAESPAEEDEGAETEDSDGRKRRRRRRRRGRRDEEASESEAETESIEVVEVIDLPATEDEAAITPRAPSEEVTDTAAVASAPATEADTAQETTAETDDETPARRRGRRGGRRRRRDGDAELATHALPGAEQPDVAPVYTGPTPANPYGGQGFDIFDVMDQVERQAEAVRGTATAVQPEAEPKSPAVVATVAWAMASTPALRRHADTAVPSETIAGIETAAVPAPSPTPAVEAPAMVAPVEAPAEPAADGPDTVAETFQATIEATADAPVPAESGPETAEVVPLPVAEEQRPEPVVKPILVGADDDAAAAPKKRGWWRRS